MVGDKCCPSLALGLGPHCFLSKKLDKSRGISFVGFAKQSWKGLVINFSLRRVISCLACIASISTSCFTLSHLPFVHALVINHNTIHQVQSFVSVVLVCLFKTESLTDEISICICFCFWVYYIYIVAGAGDGSRNLS